MPPTPRGRQCRHHEQNTVTKLRGTIRSSRSHGRRLLPVTTVEAPQYWDSEVVRALGTRLPGGVTPVTVPCKFCKSVFYPCICPPETVRIPHKRGLVAPRIVYAAESARIGNDEKGHLDQLLQELDIAGMDKGAIQICWPHDADEVDPHLLGLTSTTGNVLWREKGTYVINPANSCPVKQVVSFNARELHLLQGALMEKDGSFFVGQSQEQVVVKRATVTYRTAEVADEDLELRLVQDTKDGCKTHWEVHKVNPNGDASRQGVMCGQRVLKLLCARFDRMQAALLKNENVDVDAIAAGWEEVDLDVEHPPWCLRAPDSRGVEPPAEEFVSFPCKLIFDILPPGSKALTASPGTSDGTGEKTLQPSQEFTCDYLEELVRKGEGATLTFERIPQERVDRSDMLIRHRHFVETEQWATDQDEEELLDVWLMSNNISPSHLLFVFKKLLNAIQTEMRNFQRKKKERMETLLSKSLRCVHLQEVIDHSEADEHNAAGTSSSKKAFEVCRAELNAVFDQVPLHFLKEKILLQGGDGSQKAVDDVSSPKARRRDRTWRAAAAASGTLTPRAPPPRAPGQKLTRPGSAFWETARRTVAADDFEVTRPGRRADPAGMKVADAWSFLRGEAEQYLEQIKARGQNKPANPEDDFLKLPSMDLCSEEDGRLSAKEFEKILMMSGVNWLSRSQCQELFTSMDTDCSGRLNLGEMLTTATRVTDLVQRIQSFAKERAEAGQQLSREQLLEEFAQTLQLGKDLVGSRARPLVLDSNITASSYFLARHEHGLKQMWRSRLDCEDTCWVGDPRELDETPWIQWEFTGPHPRLVTAVVTRGRPDSDSWVKSYHLRFSTSRSPEGGEEEDEEKEWQWYSSHENDSRELFKANRDRNSRKEHALLIPMDAVFRIRLYPIEWQGRCPALRAGVFGRLSPQSLTSLSSDMATLRSSLAG